MFSILLATYNGEKYLEQSVKSVINQSINDFELLVGLNGTTDRSKDIIDSFNDPRIRIFDYGDDKGKAKTLNKLLLESKYDWIGVQDDDDIWEKTKLENQKYFIEDFDVIGTFITYIDHQGSDLNLATNSEDISKISLQGNNQIANTSAIFRRDIAFEINGWREDLDGIEDFDFWLRLIRKNKRFINLPKRLVNHRIHSNSNFNTKKYDLSKIL